MARPNAEINKQTFENLCIIQCTEEEICTVLGVTDKTLTNWCRRTYNMSFSEVFRQKREGGKASLRRMQWRLAERNAAMAIFLGKNILGQRDSIAAAVAVSEAEDDPLTKALKEAAHGTERKAEEDS